MDKINNITVNGVTYEVGGTGGTGGLGDNIYYIPTEIRKLQTGATKNDIETALGGTGDGTKIVELFDAVMAGKLILLKNGTTGAVMPVAAIAEDTTTVYIQFLYTPGSTAPLFYILSISKISTLLTTTFTRYEITGEREPAN